MYSVVLWQNTSLACGSDNSCHVQCLSTCKLQGEHESEQVIDHCTIETFEYLYCTQVCSCFKLRLAVGCASSSASFTGWLQAQPARVPNPGGHSRSPSSEAHQAQRTPAPPLRFQLPTAWAASPSSAHQRHCPRCPLCVHCWGSGLGQRPIMAAAPQSEPWSRGSCRGTASKPGPYWAEQHR